MSIHEQPVPVKGKIALSAFFLGCGLEALAHGRKLGNSMSHNEIDQFNIMTTEQQLYDTFTELSIGYTITEHPALFTVEDGRAWGGTIPGLDCKNLFLKDKKGKLWLIVMPGAKRALIGPTEKAIGSARLSFGKPELLLEVLGVTPGSVTPFALMNDHERRVTVVLDKDLLEAEFVNFHPMRNTASVTLRSKDLIEFINHLNYSPLIADCGAWESAA